MKEYRLTDWLPTTKKEVELRGWDELDVILFSGDAYVDHPSFGAAVIGRILEAEGLRVAIVPQPNWRDDLRDFKKLGRPRLFFGISPGCMDSMVNKYTANKRLRSDDAYTPDARPDMRPEYPSIVYTRILKQLFPDVPVILGGIEASMRRLTHYDYWQDRVRPSILLDSGADSLIYGMGEKPVVELANRLKCQQIMDTKGFKQLIADIPQMVYLDKEVAAEEGDITLFSHEECLKDKKKEAANFRHIEEESNKYTASRMLQKVGKQTVVVNPNDTQTLHFTNTPSTTLVIEKYIEGTTTPLKGVTFLVTDSSGAVVGRSNGEFITDENGRIVIHDLEPGTTVTAREVKTVDGFVLDSSPKSILIKAGEMQTIRFYNVRAGGLTVIKKDEKTGERIPGVQFEIRKMDGEIVGTCTTDENGVIHLPEAENGWYAVTELKAADGYRLDDTPHRVEVRDGQTATLEITNKAISGILIHKVTAVTG